MLINETKDQMDTIIDEYGNTASLYTPTIEFNDEGDRKIDLGIPKTINILVFDLSGEEAVFKIEGVDITQTYNAYIKAEETIAKQSIIKHGEDYFKILSLNHITFQDTVAFHRLIITKTKFDIK